MAPARGYGQVKLPASAIIGHRNYSLAMWPTIEAKLEEARGVHYSHANTIKIADDLQPADAGEVMIHELLHACWRGLPTNDEERIVTTLAENLAQVFADNPALVAWTMRKLRRPRAALRVKMVLKPLTETPKIAGRAGLKKRNSFK